MNPTRGMSDGNKIVLSVIVAFILAMIVYILTRLHHPGYL